MLQFQEVHNFQLYNFNVKSELKDKIHVSFVVSLWSPVSELTHLSSDWPRASAQRPRMPGGRLRRAGRPQAAPSVCCRDSVCEGFHCLEIKGESELTQCPLIYPGM